MNREQLAFRLKRELTQNVPDVWEAIRESIAEKVAQALLTELSGIPSPDGELLGELRDECKRNAINKGA